MALDPMGRIKGADKKQRDRVADRVRTVLERDREVAFAYLYGSFVELDAFHDVDVGVYLKTVKPERATSAGLAIAERLRDEVGFPVDVRILNGAPGSFLYHVLRGRLILSRDDALLAQVMEDTTRRYLDIAPLLRHSAKEAFAA